MVSAGANLPPVTCKTREKTACVNSCALQRSQELPRFCCDDASGAILFQGRILDPRR
jgi:hypothetical protein